MKIAHITTIDVSLQALLLNQLKSLQSAGYEVVTISTSGDYVSLIEKEGIRHIAVPMTRNFTPLADLVSLWRLYWVMRREQFTIVHTHTPKPGLLGQLSSRLARVPIVVNTLHGFYFHDHTPPQWRKFYILMEKIAAHCSSIILSQNKEDIQTAIREEICSPNKIKHLGNGIDIQQFTPQLFSTVDAQSQRSQLELPKNALVVGFVGRLAAKRKGFLDFLRAGQLVAEYLPETRFLIIGATDHGKEDAVEPEVAHEYGIANKCIFLGHQPNSELPSYYNIMDTLVLPSLFEGVPRAVMEAAAMNTPAIVTNVKGNREAVKHNYNGLLVPLGDVQALADAIINLLTDKEKARRMGVAGRQMAEEQFDEQLVFAKVKAEYARLLREKGLAVPSAADDV